MNVAQARGFAGYGGRAEFGGLYDWLSSGVHNVGSGIVTGAEDVGSFVYHHPVEVGTLLVAGVLVATGVGAPAGAAIGAGAVGTTAVGVGAGAALKIANDVVGPGQPGQAGQIPGGTQIAPGQNVPQYQQPYGPQAQMQFGGQYRPAPAPGTTPKWLWPTVGVAGALGVLAVFYFATE